MKPSDEPLVPFLDARAAYRELEGEIDAAVGRVLDSGRYILGEEVESFEREYAAFAGARECVGVASGLDALHLALRALGIGPGDEVLVPASTFIATWLAVTHAGATPVPVEVREETCNLDPDRLEAAISPRSRAIIAVHLYGQPAELDRIGAFARSRGLHLIEDAAQAHGARYRGRSIGGGLCAWSFYPGKNLGAMGDAGAVTTDDAALAASLRRLRNYGSPAKYEHDVIGFNSRLDPIQAAVLRVKLRRLPEWNQRRRRIAALYLEGLKRSDLILPGIAPGAEPSWHLFVVRSREREALRRRLDGTGIETLIHYPTPPHLQAAYSGLRVPAGGLSLTERLSREVLSLPIGPHLDESAAARVVEALEEVRA
jgi:dTDP-4-amino-4,6-dideoxygalactose transaminase